MVKKIAPGLLLLISGCCTTGGTDLSRVGGIVGVLIGFGLFFLVIYLMAKSNR